MSQYRSRTGVLAGQARIGISDRGVSDIATLLTAKIYAGIFPALSQIADLLGRASVPMCIVVFALEAFVRGPGFYQGSIDSEMFVGKQVRCASQPQNSLEEFLSDPAVEEAIPVLREDRHVPDWIADPQSDKPTEEQIVAHLLHELPFAADREEYLQEQSAQ